MRGGVEHGLAAAEIRDSVYQGQKLSDLTPDPAKFWGTGPDAARSKALNLYRRLERHIEVEEAAIKNSAIPLKATGPNSLSSKQQNLVKLRDLKASYGFLAGLDLMSRGLSPEDKDRNKQQQLFLDDLTKKMEGKN